eukprot:3919771-Rhodomonas_salina.2
MPCRAGRTARHCCTLPGSTKPPISEPQRPQPPIVHPILISALLIWFRSSRTKLVFKCQEHRFSQLVSQYC